MIVFKEHAKGITAVKRKLLTGDYSHEAVELIKAGVVDSSNPNATNIALSKAKAKDLLRLDVLREVDTFLIPFITQRVQRWIDNGYDYGVCYEGNGAKGSKEALRVHVHRQSKKAQKELKISIASIVEDLTESELRILHNNLRLHNSGSLARDIVSQDILAILPPPNLGESFDLELCGPELDFLKTLSYTGIEAQLQRLDRKKISYLVGLLQFSSTSKDKSKEDDLLKLLGYLLKG